MTPEERSLLERTHNLAEENNTLLRSMRRMARISGAFRAIYWIVIIGASVGAYYFVQPYLTQLLDVYGQVEGGIGSISSFMTK